MQPLIFTLLLAEAKQLAESLESLGDGATISVKASYIQIYREVLQDLSSKAPAEDLKILSLPNPIPP